TGLVDASPAVVVGGEVGRRGVAVDHGNLVADPLDAECDIVAGSAEIRGVPQLLGFRRPIRIKLRKEGVRGPVVGTVEDDVAVALIGANRKCWQEGLRVAAEVENILMDVQPVRYIIELSSEEGCVPKLIGSGLCRIDLDQKAVLGSRERCLIDERVR